MSDNKRSFVGEWVHINYPESAPVREVYGFTGMQGTIQLEGIRYLPVDRPSRTLMVYMHPASTLQLLPVPRAMAAEGMHVLCAGSRYARNDTPLILENVLRDLAAYIHHSKSVWGYEKVVLAGWSGGGSLTALYQAQAERPSITQTPAGDPVDLSGLTPGDAVIFHAAHLSRAEVLTDLVDPSILDEYNPSVRDPELDLYNPKNPNQPPYTDEFLKYYRSAQVARVRRRTVLVKELLEDLRTGRTREAERALVFHRTVAEPRFLDGSIDPNDRRIGWCFLGDPELANSSPAGPARYSTLRAWLSQWSIDDTRAKAVANAKDITVPTLTIENSADDVVPQPHCTMFHNAVASKDKRFMLINGANHYYQGQPNQLKQVVDATLEWMRERNLAD